MIDLSFFPILPAPGDPSPSEVRELARRIERGDAASTARITLRDRDLIVAVLRRYAP